MKIYIHLKHIGTNPMALPATVLVGPAPMPDLKVGDQFHIEGTPDDVWWEVMAVQGSLAHKDTPSESYGLRSD